MIYLFIILGAFFCLLFQSTVFSGSLLHYLRPDCILALTIFCGFHLSPFPGLLLAFFLGYLADTLSGAPSGWNSFYMTLVFFLTHGLRSQIFIGGIWARIMLVIVFVTFKGPCFLIVMKAARHSTSLSKTMLFHWIGEAGATVLVTFFLFLLMYRIQGMEFFFSTRKEKHLHP